MSLARTANLLGAIALGLADDIQRSLCPRNRCADLVDDYYVKFQPVDQVERLVGISNWRKLHGIMDTFALANRFLGFSIPL